MWCLLKVFSQLNKEKGFNLIEMLVIIIITGIATAIGTPSLVNARRQDITNQAFNQIKGALTEAQVNANRLSTDCTVTVGTNGVTGAPGGCLLQNVTYDDDIVSVTARELTPTPTALTIPTNLTVNFRGNFVNSGTPLTDEIIIEIARKDFNGTALLTTGKCIVVNGSGMVRSGVYDASVADSNCRNPENDRYR